MSAPRQTVPTGAPDIWFGVPATPRQLEERLAGHLVDRKLLEPEDLPLALGQKGEPAGPEPFLARCVSNRVLTNGQSKRIKGEMADWLRTPVPGFRLEKRLGKGSTSIVFHANQVSLNRMVALKVLDDAASARPDAVKSFVDSNRRAAALAHPTLVAIHDAGLSCGHPWCAMEAVLVPTAEQLLAKRGPLDPALLRRVARQAMECLAYFDSKGVVHRDIKPGNMFIDGQGNLKVSDLGLALWAADAREQQAMERGLAVGTPHYMAPEQVMGKAEIDGRADLYALGCSIFHLATGSVPFKGTTPAEVQDQHLDAPVPDPRALRPDLPDDMADLATRLMSKDPARRDGRKA
jgi:serine/threonine-protein kinase